MGLSRRIKRQRHCAHVKVRGIYGDEINHTPGGRRIQCRECGAFLDGPVSIALYRQLLEPYIENEGNYDNPQAV